MARKWRKVSAEIINDLSELGAVVQGLRWRDNMSTAELADRLGTSVRYIEELEKGRRKVSLMIAKDLGAIFGTTYKMFI